MEKYLTIADICDKYQLSRKTVERWINTRSLPAIKLNEKNGAVRIDANVFERWLNEQNSKNLSDRIHWWEYELKYRISMDLLEATKDINSSIKEYDCFKFYYPQDFYVVMKNGKKILIQIAFYGYEGEKFFDNVAERIQQIYNKDEIDFISVSININNYSVPKKSLEYNKVKFVVVEPSEVLQFNIIEHFN
jgi:hypothetical protein